MIPGSRGRPGWHVYSVFNGISAGGPLNTENTCRETRFFLRGRAESLNTGGARTATPRRSGALLRRLAARARMSRGQGPCRVRPSGRRGGGRASFFGRTAAGQRVVYVCDRHDTPFEADVLPGLLLRVAVSIPAFMVVKRDCAREVHGAAVDVSEQAPAIGRVLLDPGVFFVGQPSGFRRYFSRHKKLADVAYGRRQADIVNFFSRIPSSSARMRVYSAARRTRWPVWPDLFSVISASDSTTCS